MHVSCGTPVTIIPSPFPSATASKHFCQARKGEKRFHLPGDKAPKSSLQSTAVEMMSMQERIPTGWRQRRKRRRHQQRNKSWPESAVEILHEKDA